MIYLFTALYSEAHIFIEWFHLKKVMENTRFQQFADGSGRILLTVSGVGEIAAACAVSCVCTQYPPEQDDFLLNVGSCAAAARQGDIFLIHKLTEAATGKTFYPDIWYRHGFQEAGLVTGMTLWKRSVDYLYDMEAAAIYQAGAYFFGPHQMIFLKIVSDDGEGNRLTAECMRQLMETRQDEVCIFSEQLLRMQDENRQGKLTGPVQLKQEERMELEQWLHRLCADLHCSKAMADSLRRHLRYAVLAGIDYRTAVQEMYRENRLPCRDKREGKQCFEELKQRLL